MANSVAEKQYKNDNGKGKVGDVPQPPAALVFISVSLALSPGRRGGVTS